MFDSQRFSTDVCRPLCGLEITTALIPGLTPGATLCRHLRWLVELLNLSELFNRYQLPQPAKALIANSAHDNQMLRTAKRAVVLTVFDDVCCQTPANAG